MVGVKKRENESIASLLRRFSQRVQKSKILIKARSDRFYKSPKSKLQKKEEALRKIQWRKEIEKLRKLGKIE